MLQPTEHLPVFYSVCLFPYDTMDRFHGPLAQLRRQFFETGKGSRVSGRDDSSGQPFRYKGIIRQNRLKWLKRSGRLAVEETEQVSEGSRLLVRNLQGQLAAQVLYQENRWVKTEYFRPGSQFPQVTLEPDPENGCILRQDYDPRTSSYSPSRLYPCPIYPGTARQSRINSQAGVPQLLAYTSLGDLCYCTREEQVLRLALEKEWEEAGGIESLPVFSPRPVAPPAPAAPEPLKPPVSKPAKSRSRKSSGHPDGSYSANHEVLRVEVEAPARPHASRYWVAVKRLNGPVLTDHQRLSQASHNHREPESKAEGEPPPLWGQKAAKRIVISAEESCLYFGELLDGMRTGRGRTQQPSGATAYEGGYRNDQRDGWGVSYYRSGEPCYIGGWKENRRHGLGATFQNEAHALHISRWQNGHPGKMASLFDREGNLRFAGRLENGIKQGAGVSYQSDSGTVFVGKWKDNQPTGEGTEFDGEGNLVYTGMWKDGKRHGHGTEFDTEGNVIFSGEWRDGAYYEGVCYHRLPEK